MPEIFKLWVEPKQDAEFQRALKQHRIMEVHQATVGAKANLGTVGFSGDRQAQWLLFPRSLKTFESRHVVGVKYELLDVPAVPTKAAKVKAKPVKKKAAPKPKPAERKIVPFHAAPRAELKKSKPQLDLKTVQSKLRRVMKTLQAGKAVEGLSTDREGRPGNLLGNERGSVNPSTRAPARRKHRAYS